MFTSASSYSDEDVEKFYKGMSSMVNSMMLAIIMSKKGKTFEFRQQLGVMAQIHKMKKKLY